MAKRNQTGKRHKKSMAFDRITDEQQVAAEAYQVIGALAVSAGLFDRPEVQKALDYFGDIANGDKPTRAKDILPWYLESR